MNLGGLEFGECTFALFCSPLGKIVQWLMGALTFLHLVSIVHYLIGKRLTSLSLISLIGEFELRLGRRDICSHSPNPAKGFSCIFLSTFVDSLPSHEYVFWSFWKIKIPKKVQLFVWHVTHRRANRLNPLLKKLSALIGSFGCLLC